MSDHEIHLSINDRPLLTVTEPDCDMLCVENALSWSGLQLLRKNGDVIELAPGDGSRFDELAAAFIELYRFTEAWMGDDDDVLIHPLFFLFVAQELQLRVCPASLEAVGGRWLFRAMPGMEVWSPDNLNQVYIPHPDNPEHTDNLTSIPKLEAQGWQGTDASLEVSIFDYEFAWRELQGRDEDEDDLVVIHGHPHADKRYLRTTASSRTDLRKEHSWIDWPDFLKTNGMTDEEFDEMPFPDRLYQLYNCYGALNIFGDAYDEGFRITDPQDS